MVELKTVHPERSEFVIVEEVALVFTRVELETVVVIRFTFVKLVGDVVVEFNIVDVPEIPSAVDEAIVGNREA